MSVQNAINFIQKVEKDKKLKGKIRRLGSSADLVMVVKVGVEAGLEFSVEELQIAFAKDWEARRFFYKSKAFK